MMKPRVYVETSVVSYLTARPARDIVIAGRQQSTRDWWAGTKERFELVISELVREEAAVGDRDAAAARPRIEAVCRDAGIDPPLLCTPEQLVVAEDDDET